MTQPLSHLRQRSHQRDSIPSPSLAMAMSRIGSSSRRNSPTPLAAHFLGPIPSLMVVNSIGSKNAAGLMCKTAILRPRLFVSTGNLRRATGPAAKDHNPALVVSGCTKMGISLAVVS